MTELDIRDDRLRRALDNLLNAADAIEAERIAMRNQGRNDIAFELSRAWNQIVDGAETVRQARGMR